MVTSTFLRGDKRNSRARQFRIPVLYSRGTKFHNFYLSCRFYKTLKEAHMENHFDLIHFHSIWSFPTLVGFLFARLHKIPYVISPRSSLFQQSLVKNRLFKIVLRKIFIDRFLKQAKAVHVTSEQEANDFSLLKLNNNIELISNGVSSAEFIPLIEKRAAQQALGLSSSHRYILFLSRIEARKQLDLLFIAYEKAALPKEWKLLICGTGETNYVQTLVDLAENLRISDRVIFCGHLGLEARLMAYWASELFVLPSKFENFGMAIAEAMAAHLPVIVSTNTPWKDIQKKNCGWVMEPTVDKLKEALTIACNTPSADLKKMGANAAQIIISTYDWSQSGVKTTESYENILYKN
nr:glycosyltransferase [Halopseudomonas salina]